MNLENSTDDLASRGEGSSSSVQHIQQQRPPPPTTRFTIPAQSRRSSSLTDFSPEDFLLPKVVSVDGDRLRLEPPSHWHSLPLAFALLPAFGGLLFTNGSSVITDVMLLGFATVLLNWSVKLPWDWYHAAQTIRIQEECSYEAAAERETDDESHSEASRTFPQDIAEEGPPPTTPIPPKRKTPLEHETAAKELLAHELLALLSCFISPLVGAYLLHAIRSQLTRPSEGLVSNCNLTIFLFAAEMRPLSLVVKLIQARTLHIQRIVASNPCVYDPTASTLAEINLRLIELESKNVPPATNGGEAKAVISPKQVHGITTSIRQIMQPEIDALTRAVRRYEKRATVQTLHTDARLLALESSISDAVSLAAAAANGSLHSLGLTGRFIEWVGAGLMLPLQGLISLAALPVTTLVALIAYAKGLFGPKEEVDRRARRSTVSRSTAAGFRRRA